MGICHESHDLDFKPISSSAPDSRAQAICSPEDTKTSYSNLSNFLLICLDFLILQHLQMFRNHLIVFGKAHLFLSFSCFGNFFQSPYFLRSLVLEEWI